MADSKVTNAEKICYLSRVPGIVYRNQDYESRVGDGISGAGYCERSSEGMCLTVRCCVLLQSSL